MTYEKRDNPGHQLRVIRDVAGKKIGERLYAEYIAGKKEDYTRSAEFLIALDRLVSEFGGQPIPDDDDKSPRGRQDDSYGDDQDLHSEEASEVDFVKQAMIKVLAGGR